MAKAAGHSPQACSRMSRAEACTRSVSRST